ALERVGSSHKAILHNNKNFLVDLSVTHFRQPVRSWPDGQQKWRAGAADSLVEFRDRPYEILGIGQDSQSLAVDLARRPIASSRSAIFQCQSSSVFFQR